jgi:hypothetical protein
MARDLIPPPAPAGRPLSAGKPLLVEIPSEGVAEEPVVRERPAPARVRNRIGFLIGALLGTLLAAGLVLAMVIANPDGEELASDWSSWRPADTSIEGGAAEIASEIGAKYRHADGRQIVHVTGSRLGIDVLLRPAGGPIEVYDGPGVIYELNGLGPNGSINHGTPSRQRQQLMRREALELALYTFRYLPDVELVVALLPPPPPQSGATTASAEQQTALFYRPGDLHAQLQVPIDYTVSPQPPIPEMMGGAEGAIVDQLTGPNFFRWSVTRTHNQARYLVLDRPTP